MTRPDTGSPADEPSSASSDPVCGWCGGPIPGQHRNGFCSDRCRLRARRAAVAAVAAQHRGRVADRLMTLEVAVSISQAALVRLKDEVAALKSQLRDHYQSQG